MEIVNIISAFKARKLISKGHIAYLAHVMDTQAIRKEPESVEVVCEYLDVSPKEISGLPPMREIDFTIKVVLGKRQFLNPLIAWHQASLRH